MQKKRLGLLGVLIIGAFSLVGCSGNVKDEKEILEDFSANYEDLDFLSFNDIEIEKRQTNKDQKTDTIYALISGDGEYATQNYDCVLYYNYYDKGGWILDSVEINELTVEDLTPPDDKQFVEDFKEDPSDMFGGNYTEFDCSYIDSYFSEEDSSFSISMNYNISYEGALSYTANGECYITEYYDTATGSWEWSNVNQTVFEQNLDNIESLLWRRENNTYGYYTICKLKKIDEVTYGLYAKSFNDKDEDITKIVDDDCEWDENGYALTALLMDVNFPYGRAWEYREYEEKDVLGSTGGQWYFNWADGSCMETLYNYTYSLTNEVSDKKAEFNSEAEESLTLRKNINFN